MQRYLKRYFGVALALAVLGAGVVACRSETQNQLRRNLQDFTGSQMYITLYTLDGVPVFEGTVDGKVTRSSAALSGDSGQASGSYVFWYDDRGRYHQSSLPYLVTSYDRSAEVTGD
ncbi:MAG: hypothetical protein U5L04_02330 [Trueperaceae bacterium]|nr:hypothetical protein [Trueperaceae bacterium]